MSGAHETGFARLCATTGDPSQSLVRVEWECPCGCTGDFVTGCIRGLVTQDMLDVHGAPLETRLTLDVGAIAHARWPDTPGELRVAVIDLGGALGLYRAEIQVDHFDRDGRHNTWKSVLKGQPAGDREAALLDLLDALTALDLVESHDPRDGMPF